MVNHNNLAKFLINPQKISISEVIDCYWKENEKTDPNPQWPITLINKADEESRQWITAELPYNIFEQIILPYHHHGKIILIPRGGLSLKSAYQAFKSNEKQYAKKNPNCYERINYFANNKPGTIILKSEQTTNNQILVKHIDGLHRMLGIMCSLQDKEYQPIKSIIALNI